MGKNKLSITGEDLEGSLEIINNGDNSLTLSGELPEQEGTVANGESITVTDANPEQVASIVKLEGNTTQQILPNEYQQVEYITSTGTQYIDTGFKCNQDTRVVIDLVDHNSGTGFIFGARNSYGNASYCFLTPNSTNFRTDYNTTDLTFSRGINERYLIDKNKNVTTMYKDGAQVTQQTQTYASFNPNKNMYLFTINDNNTPNNTRAKIDLYSCKIYNNGQIARDFIPCYRKSDNVIGLYDICYNVFYTNKGTGTFSKGLITPTPSVPMEIETVQGDCDVIISNKNILKIKEGNFSYLTYSSWNIEGNVATTSINDITYQGGAVDFSTGLTGRWAGFNNKDNHITTNGGTYTLTVTRDGEINYGTSGSVSIYYYIYKDNGDNRYLNLQVNKTELSNSVIVDLKSDEHLGYMALYSQYAQCDNVKISLQLEKGSTFTGFVDHKGYTKRLDLGGKNLFKYPYTDTTKTTNGITFTDNGDGSITISGTASAQAIFYLRSNTWAYDSTNIIQKGTYTFNQISTNSNIFLGLNLYDTNNTSTYYQSSTEDKTFTVSITQSLSNPRIVIPSGTAINTPVTVYPMLEKGSKATRYSPYNPNPIDLCKIGDYKNIIDKSTGKNILNLTDGTYSANGITAVVKNGTVTLNRTASSSNTSFVDIPLVNPITLKVNEAYTFSASNNFTIGNTSQGGTYASIRLGTNAQDDSTTDVVFGILDNSYTFHKTAGITYTRVRIRTASGLSYSNNMVYPQLETGITKSDFEPYGKVWYVKKDVEKVVLNGSETWNSGAPATGIRRFYKTFNDIYTYNDQTRHTDKFLNNRFKIDSTGTIGTSFHYQNQLFFYMDGNEFDTTAKWNTWLSTNNLTLYYVLKNTQYILLNDYVSNQLEELQALGLYENLTNIEWSGYESPTMTLKYNYDITYNYDLGVQDFILNSGKHYEITSNGMNMILKNNDTVVYSGSGIYTPNTDLEVTSASLVIPLGKQFSTTVYPVVAVQSGFVTTDFDFHYVDTLGVDEDAYKCLVDTSKKGCVAKYFYTFDQACRFRSYADGNIYTYQQLNGRKITAIGFACNWIGGGYYTTNREVLAVLDTSKYSLYLNSNVVLNISRVDEITSNAIFFTNTNEVKGPIHLNPLGLEGIKKQVNFDDGYSFYREGLAKLVGVYASNYFTNEGSELSTTFTRDGSTISVDNINLVETHSSILPSATKYLNSSAFLQNSGNKYLLYKYKIYQPILTTDSGGVTTTFEDTGLSYYMATEIPHFGSIDLKIKYERS